MTRLNDYEFAKLARIECRFGKKWNRNSILAKGTRNSKFRLSNFKIRITCVHACEVVQLMVFQILPGYILSFFAFQIVTRIFLEFSKMTLFYKWTLTLSKQRLQLKTAISKFQQTLELNYLAKGLNKIKVKSRDEILS